MMLPINIHNWLAIKDSRELIRGNNATAATRRSMAAPRARPWRCLVILFALCAILAESAVARDSSSPPKGRLAMEWNPRGDCAVLESVS